MANTRRRRGKPEYTHSPWSGRAYEHVPTVEELTDEGLTVLKNNPAIAKAMRTDAMDRFIETYRREAERAS